MEDEERLKVSLSICDSKLKLCQFIDAKDWDGYRNLLTQDFRMDVYKQFGTVCANGRSASIKLMRKHIDNATTVHTLEGAKMSTDGKEATAHFSMQIRVIFGTGGLLMSGRGVSCERWVHQFGEWKIARVELKKWRTERRSLASESITIQ